jgi:hypothetical protein
MKNNKRKPSIRRLEKRYGVKTFPKNIFAKILLIVGITFSTTFILSAQTAEDREYIISNTNVERLEEIAKEYKALQAQFKDSTLKSAAIQHKDSTEFFAQFDKNGNPVYYSLENESSAASSKVDLIRTGGSTGLNLDGKDIVFGLWDSGIPRTTHQEFSGKVNVNDAVDIGYHATHITGMLIASGVDVLAKGMAPGATVSSFSTTDWNSEVAEWAADGGMISTHSYIIANPQTDYEKFGIYNTYSQAWDELSYNAPYLIMCTGASNNGNNNYNPDGSRYDLLASNKLGKNSIVVGACYDVLTYINPFSVEQAPFTSWGPSDDWRIKPDITAVGTDSYSTREASNDNYGTGQGCSYAGPVVAGGLALLQQHYHDKNGVYMKAATAKGLILSTTDEAGSNDGPDFSNGWGLFNAVNAAEVITNNGTSSTISELTLEQSGTYSTTINVDGTNTLTASICWNDPPAEPLTTTVTDNTTPMLVNDLDLRISDDTNTYMPWKLEPNSSSDNYTDAAVKGDNYRDNIEVIEVKDIPAGEYTVSVSHKGTLQNGAQDFSLIINGIVLNPTSANTIEYSKSSLIVYQDQVNSNYYNIVLKNYIQNSFDVKLFNTQGQIILSKTCSGNQTKLDMTGLKPGVFIISVKTKDARLTKSIVYK